MRYLIAFVGGAAALVVVLFAVGTLFSCSQPTYEDLKLHRILQRLDAL